MFICLTQWKQNFNFHIHFLPNVPQFLCRNFWTEQKIKSPLPKGSISINLNFVLSCIVFKKISVEIEATHLTPAGERYQPEPNNRPGRWGAPCTQPLYQQGEENYFCWYKLSSQREHPEESSCVTIAKVRPASGRLKSTKGEVWWRTQLCPPCYRNQSFTQAQRRKVYQSFSESQCMGYD